LGHAQNRVRLAKVAELEDVPLYRLGGTISGHTVKQPVAAAGTGSLVWMMVRRRSVTS